MLKGSNIFNYNFHRSRLKGRSTYFEYQQVGTEFSESDYRYQQGRTKLRFYFWTSRFPFNFRFKFL